MSLIPGFLKTVKRGNLFVETGTGAGGGVWEAKSAGFERAWTIDTKLLTFGQHLPEGYNWEFHYGDSAMILRELIPQITGPATFFLDAHERGQPSPLSKELTAIVELMKFPHTIIIDDLRRYRDGTWEPAPVEIIKYLRQFGYRFEFAPNRVMWDDILVCYSKAPL